MSQPNISSRVSRVASVDRIIDHTSDTRSLILALPDNSRLRFVPGQFISIAIPLTDETRTRPYTIASPPSQDSTFEVCFNRVPNGRGAEWLFDRKPGDQLNFTGPYGTFTLDAAPPAEAIFIADSTAIAPIRPMLHRALSAASHPNMTLLYAAPTPGHILYRAEFESFAARDRNFNFEPTVIEPSKTYLHLFAEAERRWVNGDKDRSRHFYICGIGKNVSAMRDLLRNAGYERRAVHYEQW